mmetsp:Transcript_14636/g.43952  ORF Transcript_14636/g.43952 Transcript_14636/m.43952 type:complete len:396 (+) Transcript_14636:963-2150(+)
MHCKADQHQDTTEGKNSECHIYTRGARRTVKALVVHVVTVHVSVALILDGKDAGAKVKRGQRTGRSEEGLTCTTVDVLLVGDDEVRDTELPHLATAFDEILATVDEQTCAVQVVIVGERGRVQTATGRFNCGGGHTLLPAELNGVELPHIVEELSGRHSDTAEQVETVLVAGERGVTTLQRGRRGSLLEDHHGLVGRIVDDQLIADLGAGQLAAEEEDATGGRCGAVLAACLDHRAIEFGSDLLPRGDGARRGVHVDRPEVTGHRKVAQLSTVHVHASVQVGGSVLLACGWTTGAAARLPGILCAVVHPQLVGERGVATQVTTEHRQVALTDCHCGVARAWRRCTTRREQCPGLRRVVVGVQTVGDQVTAGGATEQQCNTIRETGERVTGACRRT